MVACCGCALICAWASTTASAWVMQSLISPLLLQLEASPWLRSQQQNTETCVLIYRLCLLSLLRLPVKPLMAMQGQKALPRSFYYGGSSASRTQNIHPLSLERGPDSSNSLLQLQSRLRLGPNDGKLFLDVGDVEEIECDDAKYDAILCSASMSYLLDPVQALRQWRWWLKPGGRLCFNIDAAP